MVNRFILDNIDLFGFKTYSPENESYETTLDNYRQNCFTFA